jgi:hypothetical protein
MLRRHKRLVLALVLVAALTAAVIAVASVGSSRDAMDDCTATPPGAASPPGAIVAVDWEWLPPGYVCVFEDRNGRELERRRP